jgi:hypothetical protein
VSVLALTALLLAAEPDAAPPENAAPQSASPGPVSPEGASPAGPPSEAQEKLSPWYLPRWASFETYIWNGAVVPSLHTAWEINLIEQPRNTFVFIAELGFSYAVSTPAGLGSFFENFAIAGLGYRMQRDGGFHWGFTVGFGATLYGNNGPMNMNELKASTYVEGKLHLGWRFKPFTVSLCGGWGQPVTYDFTSVSQNYVGGPFIGVMVGWK